MALHVAPCAGLPDRPWPPALEAHWLVRVLDRQPGFEPPDDPVFSALNAGLRVWDGRAGVWVDAAPEAVLRLSRRAYTAVVAPDGPALAEVESAWAAASKHARIAALKARLGKPVGPAPPCPEAPLLATPAEPSTSAVAALAQRGPALLWRVGDAAYGLHAIALGPLAFWVARSPVPVVRHEAAHTLPQW